ncbi:MAG: hypothetical protein R3Y52_04255 [Psittacicella sp.]
MDTTVKQSLIKKDEENSLLNKALSRDMDLSNKVIEMDIKWIEDLRKKSKYALTFGVFSAWIALIAWIGFIINFIIESYLNSKVLPNLDIALGVITTGATVNCVAAVLIVLKNIKNIGLASSLNSKEKSKSIPDY